MQGELYPLTFKPYLQASIWGNRKLETFFHKPLPPNERIGESWEIFDQNTITNGPLAGRTLADAVGQLGQALVGKHLQPGARFPLLLKLSSTQLDLSVQVHPDDAYARTREPDNGYTGKTEMIYILDTEPGARVFYGLRGEVSREMLQTALTENSIVDILQELAVRPGDVIFVPPGVVHAYGAGLIYLELQQTSNLTYRLFDWNRVDANGRPRPLHIAQALDSVDYAATDLPRIQPVCVQEDYGRRCLLTACRHFVVERLNLSVELRTHQSGDSFHILCVIDGKASLRTASQVEPELRMGLGDVVLLPASLGTYRLVPDPTCQVVRSYVPNLKRDVVDDLAQRGIPTQTILRLGGGLLQRNDLAPLLGR